MTYSGENLKKILQSIKEENKTQIAIDPVNILLSDNAKHDCTRTWSIITYYLPLTRRLDLVQISND